MTRSRIFFILGFVSLGAMALLSSLDPSFIYLFLGLSLFLFFLAYYSGPQKLFKQFFYQQEKRTPYSSAPSESIFNIFQNIFSGRKVDTGATPRVLDQKSKSLILGVIIFIFSIFFIIIISVLASDDNYSMDAVEDFQKAEQFRWNGEYDSAQYYYRRTLSSDPEYVQALTGFGNTWLSTERYDSAHAYFDKAIELDPQSEDARYGKALTYYYQKNYKASLQETLALRESNPEYFDATLLAGDNYYVQQRYDSALYWYEDGYGHGVRNAGLCHVMAYIYDTKGQQEKAVLLYKEALSFDSTRVQVYERLGELVTGQESEFYRSKAKKLKDEGYEN